MMHTLRVTVAIAIVVVCGLATNARAEDKDKAREAYAAASQHYDLGEYNEALAGFKEAYRNFEDPAFLFNIAQCHRQLGDASRAILEYRMYLVKLPEAPNRADVEALIEKLEGQSGNAHANNAAPPAADGPAATETVEPAAAAPPATTGAATAGSVVVATPPAPAARRSLAKKWWLWTGVGAVVVAGVAVGLGVGLTQRRGFSPTLPNFQDQALR